jgi:hypothetical protein
MINEIKMIVQNYLNNAKLSSFMDGVVVEEGIRISDKIILPEELIVGNLKSGLIYGQKVRLLRNHGGQKFYILEVIVSD